MEVAAPTLAGAMDAAGVLYVLQVDRELRVVKGDLCSAELRHEGAEMLENRVEGAGPDERLDPASHAVGLASQH